MLPTRSRLHTAGEFTAVVRNGRRAGTPTLVIHLLQSTQPESRSSARAGFVVTRKIGNAVMRHQITRRLRPLVRSRMSELPPDVDVVVRALPAAAGADSVALARDLTAGLRAAARKAGLSPLTPAASG